MRTDEKKQNAEQFETIKTLPTVVAFINMMIEILKNDVVILLTHCGLVTSYGERDLGQHWLR